VASAALTPVRWAGDRRWLALAFIALAQLMIALDATIVSIALPSAQAALGASDADRQWVVTAYTLAFGGLLLLGGRVADHLGRRRALLLGLAGFALASALGGAAPTFVVLVGARALQGAFAAVLAPAALSLLAVSFTRPRERATAFAVYGSIAGTGAAVGLLLGGALTQELDWRWCLAINVPVALVAAAGSWFAVPPAPAYPQRPFDLAGAVLATAGLCAVVYGCAEAVALGWRSVTVGGAIAGGAVLLVLFVWWERRAPRPLLPLRVVLDRDRGGAYLTVALAIAGMFGAFLFLTYYLQVVLRYSPLQAGLAFLPLTAASQAGSWGIANRLLPRVPPRALMVPGALVAAAGLAVLTRIQVDSDYLTHVLPAELLLGLGTSCAMVPAFSTATQGVDRRDAGVASAMVGTAQQIGGSLGIVVLNTIAAGATVAFLASSSSSQVGRGAALVHGYSVAMACGAAILVLAAAAAAALVTRGRPASTKEENR
jgi:EmrB/QacA subfamily drug resistance transporter